MHAYRKDTKDPKKFDPSKALNKLRNCFLNEIESNEQISAGQHFYTITAPTGIGKTFGCLAFANKLKACLNIGEGRIIYCLPYTSIIDQNYDEFEDIIKFHKKDKYRDKPSRYLLKHHHLEIKQIINRVSIEEYRYKDYLDDCLWVESWQSAFIVTTFVQLFHSIIGFRNRLLKKFHNIVNAIVILDEIQCINPEYYQLLRTILDVLGKRFNTYFLLITATQPEILDTVQSRPVELVSSAQYMNSNELNRVRLEIEPEPISLDQFMVRFCDSFNGENALIVMNTKKCAIETYYAIKLLKKYKAFCLTTRLIPRDRKKKIKQIKSALKNNEKVIVASTQLIEAGVDFSFKYVYRDFAPLEAIVQTAGRCNRNGEYGFLGGKLILLRLENKMPYCLRVYNRKLIQFTKKILIENQYEGRDFYDLTQKYYSQFDFVGKSKLIMQAILELNYDADYYGQIPVKEFKLIEDYDNEAIYILTTKDSQLKMDELVEYLFCPRFSYFEYVLDITQKEEKRFKVQKGRDIHRRIRKTNPNYLRKKLGVVDKKSDVYLSSPIGIRGIVDEILFLEDGTAAPLDYKYAEYKNKLFKTYRMQLVFYARLIRDHFKVPVMRGYIIYTRSRNKLVEVPLAAEDFRKLDKTIKGLWDVIIHSKYPLPTRYKRRCPDCCYRNICERSV